MKSFNVDDSIWARIERWEPYVTLRLIVINAVVFLASSAAQPGRQDTPVFDRFGMDYLSVVMQNQHYRMFTAMFLHDGWMHIFNNMLFLALLGYMVERPLGRARFLLAYFGAGYLGFVFALVWQYDPQVAAVSQRGLALLARPTVGASGAVLGMLGVWLAYERSLRVSLSQMWHSPNGQRVMVFTGYYVIASLVGINPRVSHSAHLGGIVGGFLLGFFLFSMGYRGRTLPRQGWMALAAYLALAVGGLVYAYQRAPGFNLL
ncbi:rhomboid family intramembrane serine protease [bacterium]|nr:rhomboid family intramembrane serine protease [bacterium]